MALWSHNQPAHCPADNEFYEIRAVPGKGYGSFALKDLKRGTRILSEPPLLTVSNGHYLIADIEETFSQLSADEQKTYWSLASSHGQDPKKWPSKIHESVVSAVTVPGQKFEDAMLLREK